MNKIKSISVTQLFGYEGNDYKVELVEDEPLSFIYAFNGVGKSTLLKLLDATLNRRFYVLDSIQFKTFTIVFDNDDELIVEKVLPKKFDEYVMGELKHDEKYQTYYIDKEDKNIKKIIIDKYYYPIMYKYLEKSTNKYYIGKYYFENIVQVKIHLLLNRGLSKCHFLEDPENNQPQIMLSDFENYPKNYFVEQEKELDTKIEEQLNSISAHLNFVNKDYNRTLDEKYIDSSRLRYNEGTIDWNSIFEPYSAKDEIHLEYSYLEELLKHKKTERKDLDDIATDLPEYGKGSKYYNLVTVKIPDKIQILVNKMQNTKMNSKKIKLFEEIINKRPGLAYKEISINRKTGEIKCLFNNDESTPLDLTCLSSGEKNLLLLYFWIIFELPEDEEQTHIIMLDEPEVSLSPTCLVMFYDNLMHINEVLGRGDNFQYIISTQSPSIAYNHNELLTKMVKK